MNTTTLAVQDYLRRLPQMGARKAAEHVIQTYGITARELREGIVLEREYHAPENLPETVVPA